MFVATVGKGKLARVYVFEGYREKGKSKKRIVERLGYLSDLTKDDPDALEKLKAQFEKSREDVKAQKQAEEAAALESLCEVKASARKRVPPRVLYSNFIIRIIWIEYGLFRVIYNLQEYHNKQATFSYNDVIFTESFLKIIHPCSIRASYRFKSKLLGAPLSGVSLDQMYDALSFLNEHKNTIINNLNKNIDKKLKREKSLIFYDVTNTYIETQLSDEDKNYVRKNCMSQLNEVLAEAMSENLITQEIADSFIENSFDFEVLPEAIRAEVRSAIFLRMPGPSKEKRFDLPLVSIALIVDNNAVPIDIEVFSGNASEYKTMPKAIKKLQKKHNVTNTIVVADRGINSTANTKMLLELGYGFVVAQKISNLQKNEKEIMLDKTGYTEKYILKDNELPATDDNIFDIQKYKMIDYEKRDNKGNQVKCKLVFTYSKKREERDNKLIDKDEETARKAVESNKEIPSQRKQWINYVNKQKGKKIIAESINEKALNEKRKIAGYSGVIYHCIPGKEDSFSDEQILSIYHQLVQIEDCFRIMKTNLGLRPMFVRLEDHIVGHTMLCYLALTMLRILQVKLQNFKMPMTIDEIIESLQKAEISVLCNENGNDVYTNSCVYDIYRGSESLSEQQVRKKLSSIKHENKIDIIMKCLNLTPLPSACDRTSLLNSLGTKLPSSCPLIDPVLRDFVMNRLEEEGAVPDSAGAQPSA